jgi:acyl carrier protein
MTTTRSGRAADSSHAAIKDIVCEILEVELDEMTDTSLFNEDHGADSLRTIEILSSLERAYGIEIDQAELTRMVNLESVITVVNEAPDAK